MRPIKAWAIVEKKGNYLGAESIPNWGRLWVFKTRKQAREEIKSRFYNSPRRNVEKVVKIKIISENPKLLKGGKNG